jgi:polyphosphate glucokinase
LSTIADICHHGPLHDQANTTSLMGSTSTRSVLVIDIGGTTVKLLVTGKKEPRKFPSGPGMTARAMVDGVQRRVRDWKYDVISVGYPGPVRRGRPEAEPRNLGLGWVGFNFEAAFATPVKVINDAAMQALGSYRGGTMLFLGLGTGLGSALIVDSCVHAMELAHLPYKRGSYEDYVGIRGLKKYGETKWRRLVVDVVEALAVALRAEEVVLGGGNVKRLKKLPSRCRAGENADAFAGGFRLWEKRAASGQLPIRIA